MAQHAVFVYLLTANVSAAVVGTAMAHYGTRAAGFLLVKLAVFTFCSVPFAAKLSIQTNYVFFLQEQSRQLSMPRQLSMGPHAASARTSSYQRTARQKP